MRRAHRVQSIGAEQRGGDGEQPQYLASAQAGFAEYFEHIRQQGNAGAEQYHADDVERIVAMLTVIRQMPVDQYQAAQADRYIHEEDHAPMKISDDQAAQQRPEHGADQIRNGDEAHGTDEFGFGKRAYYGEPSHGEHQGAAAALQHAAGHQHVDVVRDAAKKRAQRE